MTNEWRARIVWPDTTDSADTLGVLDGPIEFTQTVTEPVAYEPCTWIKTVYEVPNGKFVDQINQWTIPAQRFLISQETWDLLLGDEYLFQETTVIKADPKSEWDELELQ